MATRKTKAKTKKHHFHVTHIPVSSWIVFWLGIAATFVLIFVTFGTAFQAFVLDGSDLTSQALQRINQNLEKQVGELQARANNPTPTENCSVENPGPADSHVLYVDPKTHVSMSLPYSTSWGNGCAPVQTDAEGIHFGPGLEASVIILDPNEIPAFDVSMNRTVSGLKIYKLSDLLTFAIGKKYAYRIGTKGWLTDTEINKIIQSLRVVK